MDNCMEKIRAEYDHPNPKKSQLSPHKNCEINYGANNQYMPNFDDSTNFYNKGIKRVQSILGALLYYARFINTKFLVSLCDNGSQQAAATENTKEAIDQLFNYVTTYPNDDITYQARNIILARQSDATYLLQQCRCVPPHKQYYSQRSIQIMEKVGAG